MNASPKVPHCRPRSSPKTIPVAEVNVGHVLAHSLGVATVKEGRTVIEHVIPSLTPLPCAQSRDGYTTTFDNQNLVQIRVYEGESTDPAAYSNGPIGVFNWM
jgi:molecular chaperone DnaK